MTVADVQAAQKRLMVPVSRKGGASSRRLTSACASATTFSPRWRRRRPAERVRASIPSPALATDRRGEWEKAERGPWFAAAELTRPWAAIVARAGLAAGTIPYALRHSSIVRGLRAGLPVRLVAALHDTSVAMIERHYAAFIVDAMDELAARAVVPLTTAPATVTPIEQARR